jgi:hypothetical protein
MMKRLALVVAAGAMLSAAIYSRPMVQAQSAEAAKAPPAAAGQAAAEDLFNGSWKINRSKSRVARGESPLKEDITIKVEDGIEHYKVDVTTADGVSNKNQVDAKFNDGKWYPYTNVTTGKSTSQVMMIRVDPRTESRFMKNAAGQSTGVLMRRMAEDGKSYTSTMMTLDGEISLVRYFERP